MKWYTALLPNGNRIVTVPAETEDEGRRELKRQLDRPNNPSRMAYYNAWLKSGAVVEESDSLT